MLEDILQMVVGSTLEFCFYSDKEINQCVRLHNLEKSKIPIFGFSWVSDAVENVEVLEVTQQNLSGRHYATVKSAHAVYSVISFCLLLHKKLFFLLRSQVLIEIGMDCVLSENSKTILTPITEFVETAKSCRTELKSNLSTQLNLCMRLCISLLIFFV